MYVVDTTKVPASVNKNWTSSKTGEEELGKIPHSKLLTYNQMKITPNKTAYLIKLVSTSKPNKNCIKNILNDILIRFI